MVVATEKEQKQNVIKPQEQVDYGDQEGSHHPRQILPRDDEGQEPSDPVPPEPM